MKIAIIGGTGSMGSSLGEQLAKSHEVIIGSRDPARAKATAAAIKGAMGADYTTAAKECDSAIIAIPFSAIDSVSSLAEELSGKLVISVINPMKFENGMLSYGLERGSAAEMLAAKLPRSRVATAFNNITAGFFKKPRGPRVDVVVAADSKETFDETARIVKSIPNLRPMYAGPLSEARTVERITPMMLNLAKKNETGSLAISFVSQKD
ncbi:MAG: NAD(P)-binding domain-containing protein [Nitrososphaerales archaeon]|jgi:NADPH-dependent F420 reductase